MDFLEKQFETLSNGVKTCLIKTGKENVGEHNIEQLSISLAFAFFLLMGNSYRNGNFYDVEKNKKAIDRLVDLFL